MVWEGSDATGGIAGYQYQLDGGAWSTLTGATSHTFLGLRDGDHAFVVEVIDHANNAAYDLLNFTVVDTVPPVLTLLGPSQGAYLSTSSVHVTWNATDLTSGVQGFQYRIDGNGWSALTTVNSTTFSGLADGSHTVDILAIDNADNAIVKSLVFVVDTTSPSISITSPANGFDSDSSTVKVIWFASDATAGLNGYQYRIDGGAWSSTTQSMSHDFAGLTDGPHTAEARCTDKAGNNATVPVSFVVDTIIPSVSIVSPSEGAFVTSSVTVRMSSSDPTSGISAIQYRLDGQAWTDASLTTEHTFAGVPEGMHTYDVRAFDGAGNWNRVTSTFTVDSVPPVVQIISPAAGSLSLRSSFTVSWAGSDSVSGVQGYQYRSTAATGRPVSSVTANTFSGLADGNHTVQVRVFDNAGNNGTASITVMTDTTVPTITSSTRRTSTAPSGPTVYCNWTGSDAMSGILGYQYRLDGSAWFAMTTSTGTVLTSVPDGHHILMVDGL